MTTPTAAAPIHVRVKLTRLADPALARPAVAEVNSTSRSCTSPAERPPYFPRPAEDRQIIRHKAFSLARVTVVEAIHRLDASGLPFVFFRDATTGRGCVVHHRYDGHYGLITPAD